MGSKLQRRQAHIAAADLMAGQGQTGTNVGRPQAGFVDHRYGRSIATGSGTQ
ncbi:MAG: hypothetical protein MZW92_65485 [Comamonadaceae bacterium]|nr:hypothetical protein [Comamonadaceae bacterium]